ELPHGFEETFISDGDQLRELEPVTLILLHVGDDETEICRHQALSCRRVSRLSPSRQPLLLLRLGDHRELLDIKEGLIESTGWCGAEQRARFPGVSDSRHRPPRREG